MTLTTPIELLEKSKEKILEEISLTINTLHNVDMSEKRREFLERNVMLLNMDKVQIEEAIKILNNS